MKKSIILGALLLPTLLLVGCSGDKEVKKETVKSSAEKVVKKSEEKKEPAKTQGDFVSKASDSNFDGTMLRGNSYSVRITSHKVINPGEEGNEYGDKPVIAFWYDTLVSPDYKNDRPIDPMSSWIMNFKAVQDNDPNAINELQIASLPDKNFLQSQMSQIKPGGTVANAVAYYLTDTTTPVKLTAEDMMGTEYGSFEYKLN
ncbi:MAG: DUF5067 domain-containing protein [Lactococcus raffinolactis]|uniref:DUF5067 domain-containing protein n=1 Tax=Pseudolactococcus raffinolactis TaxID=1366 RepID=UPI001C6FD62B|nr:DUF5067 domain-containing protein [Lactococcus raffinolactis]MDN5471126.1 DUF5067 domain-containing protein [Lactococcus lactis]MDN6029719.1 DUF5067 domain-containing protein [Lactococcus plantarum]MBW9297577.1 DUF5067 domain-containing protein [Lactococcus raffinolactis]MDN5415046.1 DUF5067 domain-containing protein [Lactococcus raffinolactis]MDN5487306.1 DUF5067 domain-containing protein [Lactococcus lactis]